MHYRLRRSMATMTLATVFGVWLLRCLKTFVFAVLRDDHDATVPDPPSGDLARRRVMQVSDSIDVRRSPGDLYAMVSDPTRMGEWSPENRGARILDPADDGTAFVGMRFQGRNLRNGARWVTLCTVTAADPAERFAFRVHAIGVKKPRLQAPNASWEYRFEPLPDGGTRVTEQWTDDRTRWPRPAVEVFDRIVTRGTTFPEFQRRNIATTLAALKKVAEKS
ncbi:SRPBCC family protein [Williamsia sp.]|uniref:SRPBCC family protein n=1 Tax=Williamsia sp. TaxID=1872085 RepID=UPI00345423C1